MIEFRNIQRTTAVLACALSLIACTGTAAAGSDTVDKKVAADPNGEVVISNVSGGSLVMAAVMTEAGMKWPSSIDFLADFVPRRTSEFISQPAPAHGEQRRKLPEFALLLL